MVTEDENKRRWYRVMALVSIIGLDLVGSVTVTVLFAKWLVDRYALNPIIIALAAILGFFIGIYQMLRHLKALERRKDAP